MAFFGVIASDTGFALAHAHDYRIREGLVRVNRVLTWHRLLQGLIVPPGG